MTTPPPAPRLATHRCKHCGVIIALIDDRTRYQRFALRCAECGAHLVLRPAPEVAYTVRQEIAV
jgi:predicted RNA-binding Zn-ribbon protein involved in translation (DUF1610 family)